MHLVAEDMSAVERGGERRRTWAAAIAGTVAVHVLIAWLATLAPAPKPEVEPPKPRKPIAARVVPAKRAPPKTPVVVPVVPKPVVPEPPKPVAPPVAPPPPAMPPASPPPEVAKSPPSEPAPAGSPAPPPKRSGGRTLTGKGKAAGTKTTVKDGKGRVADFGDYDSTAGAGSVAPVPDSPAPKKDGRSERESAPAAPPPPKTVEAPVKPKPEKLVPPVPKSRPAGRFPPGVPRSSQPLRVVLSLSVSATGEVESVKVVSGQGPELDAEARRLALTITFEPARRGDKAVAMTIPWTVTFK